MMGSFLMCDQNHDHKIQRDELAVVIRTAQEMHDHHMADEEFNERMDILMGILDKDKVCYQQFIIFIMYNHFLVLTEWNT